jgi:glucose/arabinose dehydrogenase
VADGITRPNAIATMPGDDGIFVADARGRVWRIDPEQGLLAEPYLDISDRVINGGIEQGLLGIVFHPEFADTGRLFTYYVDRNGDVQLAEFSGGPDAASPASEEAVLFIERPHDRHYGGMLEFGPDGYLYVAVGDAATGGDHGQDTTTLNGTILRLDVDTETPYAIPAANPFVAGGGAPEIWAFGLRNPWRFDIDPVDRLMYIGDVGQTRYEEIDVVSLDATGANFGWADMEGAHCFGDPGCDPADYTSPVVEYDHTGGSCSVTGGVVYRGSAIPELTGTYFYGDWCSGWTRSFILRDGVAADQTDWTDQLGKYGQPNSFGTDPDGEILIATWDGQIYRIVPVR